VFRRRRSRTAAPFPLAAISAAAGRPLPPSRWPRRIVIGIVGALVLLIGAAIVLPSTFDPNVWRGDIEAAVRRLTLRDFVIHGPITIQSYFAPTIAIDDLTLANVAGGSRPDMVRIARVEADLNWRELLRGHVEIGRLVLFHPDILLEVDGDGHPNWDFGAAPGTATVPAQPATAGAVVTTTLPEIAERMLATPPPTVVQTVHISDGRLTWRDARSRSTTEIRLRQVSGTESPADRTITLTGEIGIGKMRFEIDGQAGTLARLFDRTVATPWPVRLDVRTDGATFSVLGSFTRPLELGGYTLRVATKIIDSALLAPLSPVPLPVLRGVTASADIADSGMAVPDVSDLVVRMGPSDLNVLVKGLRIESLNLSAPAMDQPLRGELHGMLEAQPVAASVLLGPPAALLPGRLRPTDPFPINMAATIGDSSVEVKGSIADPAAQRGLDVMITGHLRDIDTFSPLAHRSLPPLRTVDFVGRVTDAGSGYADGVTIRDIAASVPQGDLAGTVRLYWGTATGLTADLQGRRFDLDALVKDIGATWYGLVGVPTRPLPVPAGTPELAIPDQPLHLYGLDRRHLDIRLALGELVADGLHLRDVAGRLIVDDGRVALDPLAGEVAGARFAVRLAFGGNTDDVPAELRMTVPAVPVQALLAPFANRDNLFGNLEIDADLHGTGRTPHAIASSLNGHLGLALVDGSVDARLVTAPFIDLLRAIKAPTLLLLPTGLERVRCLAVRTDVADGRAGLQALAFDVGQIAITGSGSVDLGDEALDLHFRPTLRTGGPSLVVPLKVTGSVVAPKILSDGAPVLEGAVAPASAAKGNAAGRATANPQPVAVPPVAVPPVDICGPALLRARGGRVGAQPDTIYPLLRRQLPPAQPSR
jgi:uncharacterized protein involved in outer membrane biogenesis